MGYDDEVVKNIGEFGRYQKRIYLLLCMPVIICALHKLTGVFLQAKIPHRCRLPGEAENSTYAAIDEALFPLIYPWDPLHNAVSTCQMYKTNFTDSYFHAGIVPNETTYCEKGWVYDTTNYKSTTLTEWDLVCDKAWLRAASDSALMIGVMVGAIIFGHFSDRYGRKLIFFISLVLEVIFGVIVAFSRDYYTFIFSRGILGTTISGVLLVTYVIAMELVGPKYRMMAGVVLAIFFSFGFMVQSALAYYIRDWRTLQLAVSLPGLAFLPYWWFVPESVRWLISHEKWDETKAALRSVAKENGKELPESVLDDLCSELKKEKLNESPPKEKPSFFILLKYPNLRKKLLVLFLLWFINSGTYYGLSWNSVDLGGNVYVNFLISGAVEIPGRIVLLYTLDVWGRKPILCSSMIIGGITLLLSTFFSHILWLKITFAMMGKLAISAAYCTMYILTAEHFPTVVRNVCLGACSTVARMGGILAPYVNILSEIWTPLPLIVFGVLSLISGASAFLLPETLNRTLPETIEDGENFGKEFHVELSDKINPEEIQKLNNDHI